MANQANIDSAAEIIAGIVDRAKEELINDLYNLGLNVDNIPAFVHVINTLEVSQKKGLILTHAK